MKVDISDINKINGASLDVSFSSMIQELDTMIEDFEFKSPVDFKGRLTNTGGILKLDGRLKTEYSGKCYRCLDDVSASMDVAIRESIIEEGKNEDNEAYTYQGNFVELDKVFVDNIILNLPMRLLCTKECEGLEKAGEGEVLKQDGETGDKPVDPRMEALKKFFNN